MLVARTHKLKISAVKPKHMLSHCIMSNSLQPRGLSMLASLSFTVSRSLLRFLSIKSVMLSWWYHAISNANHLLFYGPLPLLPSIFPIIRVFSNEWALCIRWPKYWCLNFNISPLMNIQEWFPFGLTCLISMQSKGLSRVFSSTTIWKHQFFSAQPSLWSNSHICTWLLEKP